MAVVTKRGLDFAVIGAQKSGTDSLFQYLRRHPRIHIPSGKEAPFFSQDERYDLGWDWYADEFFSGAPEDALWATVSPQYMQDPMAPERMHGMMPDLRLIALLRNPIHRALSHHKMMVRQGVEDRPFEEAVGGLVDEEAAAFARALRAEEGRSDCYLVYGEYARILSSYYALFPEERILVVFFEDMESAPERTYRSILRFLGVPPDFLPDNLGKRYHAGGTKSRVWPIERKLRGAAEEVEIVRRLWRAIPMRHRMACLRAYAAFHHWNTVREPPSSSTGVDPRTLAKLVDYYRPEVDGLRDLLGREVPWPEFRRAPTSTRGRGA